MKEPSLASARNRKGMTKQKKQLVVLGALCLVLVAVLAVPSGNSEEEIPEEPEAGAPENPAAPAAAEAPATTAPAPAPANEALSADEVEGSDDEGLMRSPFESFWAMTKPVETKVDDLPPPAVTLNGTLTSGRTPAAVIDGQTRFVGDVIQGWTLEAIGSREVTFISPGKNRATIRMPLLQLGGRRPPVQPGQQP
jgi:hypothetical protein